MILKVPCNPNNSAVHLCHISSSPVTLNGPCLSGTMAVPFPPGFALVPKRERVISVKQNIHCFCMDTSSKNCRQSLEGFGIEVCVPDKFAAPASSFLPSPKGTTAAQPSSASPFQVSELLCHQSQPHRGAPGLVGSRAPGRRRPQHPGQCLRGDGQERDAGGHGHGGGLLMVLPTPGGPGG